MNKFNHYQFARNLLFCSLGCIACYYLQVKFSLSSVLSSALVGLVGSFIPKSKYYDSAKAIAAIYCGSFASMTALGHFNSFQLVLVLSLIVGVCFTVCTPYFRGVGGKLGTIAFISSVVFIFGKVLWN